VIVLAAGVTMNFFLAFAIFTGLFYYGVQPMTIIPIEGYHSEIMPSVHEAIESGYLKHSGLTVTSLSGSISARAGVGSGELVRSINSIIPRTPQDIIDIIQQSDIVTLVLQSGKEIQMTPKNGKVGMQIAYRDLQIDREKQIQYSGFEAIAL
jgi:hypothetical protein